MDKNKEEKMDIKKEEKKAKKTLNYNDRMDGYGFGEADKEADKDEAEKGIDQEDAEKYGEVDQYSFRQAPLGEGEKSNEEIKKDLTQP